MRIIIEDIDNVHYDTFATYAKDLARLIGDTVHPLPLCAFVGALERPDTHVMRVTKYLDIEALIKAKRDECAKTIADNPDTRYACLHAFVKEYDDILAAIQEVKK